MHLSAQRSAVTTAEPNQQRKKTGFLFYFKEKNLLESWKLEFLAIRTALLISASPQLTCAASPLLYSGGTGAKETFWVPHVPGAVPTPCKYVPARSTAEL